MHTYYYILNIIVYTIYYIKYTVYTILSRPPITSGPNTELRWRRFRPTILK